MVVRDFARGERPSGSIAIFRSLRSRYLDPMTPIATTERQRVVRRGQWLTSATLLYNSLEGVLSIGVGVLAGSIVLVGFGADSAIEVTASAARALMGHRAPAKSVIGIVIAVVSLIAMPLLARAKRRVAVRLASGAIAAEAQQTQICAYLSAFLLVGLACNATVGWWWADPAAALAMVPLIAREGVSALRGRATCCGECV
jgi:hypothetical protein